jgi:hypothetical protein
LAISLADLIFPISNSINLVYSVFAFFSGIILSFSNSIYLCAYLIELKGETYTFNTLLKILGRNFLKLLILSVIFNIPVLLISILNKPEYLENTTFQAIIGGGFLVILIPCIILYLMFIFNTCFILDKGAGIIKAFLLSKKLSKGNKSVILKTILLFNIFLLVPAMFITLIAASASSNNTLISYFVFYFVITIINFIQQRLIGLMYMDLEYVSKDLEQQI